MLKNSAARSALHTHMPRNLRMFQGGHNNRHLIEHRKTQCQFKNLVFYLYKSENRFNNFFIPRVNKATRIALLFLSLQLLESYWFGSIFNTSAVSA
jgi:hypothetical protein